MTCFCYCFCGYALCSLFCLTSLSIPTQCPLSLSSIRTMNIMCLFLAFVVCVISSCILHLSSCYDFRFPFPKIKTLSIFVLRSVFFTCYIFVLSFVRLTLHFNTLSSLPFLYKTKRKDNLEPILVYPSGIFLVLFFVCFCFVSYFILTQFPFFLHFIRARKNNKLSLSIMLLRSVFLFLVFVFYFQLVLSLFSSFLLSSPY